MSLKPVTHKCQYPESPAEGEEPYTFYVREPSGLEVLRQAKTAKKDASAEDNAKELFTRYVVNEDGTAISKEGVEEILSFRLSAMHGISKIVQDKIGLTELKKNPKP
jgi:hypothetical protein